MAVSREFLAQLTPELRDQAMEEMGQLDSESKKVKEVKDTFFFAEFNKTVTFSYMSKRS